MGIFDKLFSRNATTPVVTTEDTEQKPVTVDKEIELILLILKNLGTLEENKIREKIKNSEYFDDSILKRMQLKKLDGLDLSEDKYQIVSSLGYGKEKLRTIKDKLQKVVTEKSLSNTSKLTIVEELIEMAKQEVESYTRTIRQLEISLEQTEEQIEDNSEKAKNIEYWTNYYKEQSLGYSVSFEKKLEEMTKELSSLPYGGYGKEEIEKFVSAAKKIIEEARLSGEESHQTLDRIHSDLLEPKKNRYLSDVETLKRKLQMIEDSPYISDFEKEQNKQKTIREFQDMNGHHENLLVTLEQLKENLTLLEYGGYGEEVIQNFSIRSSTMISDGKRVGKKEDEIEREVYGEYQRLISSYQMRLQELKERLQLLETAKITNKEKEDTKKHLIEEFHDEMGLPINSEERITAILWELKGLDYGGYGEVKLEEFENKMRSRLKNAKTRMEVRDALKDIKDYQKRLIDEFKSELSKLVSAMDRITHDRHLSSYEKGEAIQDSEREFKFKMGYRMNFVKFISEKANQLSHFSEGGYGEEAIKEFVRAASEIAEGNDDEQEKYKKIKERFQALKKTYYKNLKTFTEWKKMQLKGKSKEEQSSLDKKLKEQIKYMLSLSPDALQEYYLEDDRVKKEEREKHNYQAAFKFLAKQEARLKNSEYLYQERLAELSSGLKPYTKEELEEATNELRMISLKGEELEEEDRLISLVEYIDSTLLRQMMYAEATILKQSSN